MTRRLLASLVLVPLLAACSAADRELSDAGSAPGNGGGTAEAPASDDGSGDGSIEVPSFPSEKGRLLIVTMYVGLEVADVGTAVDDLLKVAELHNAQLSSSNVDVTTEEYARGELVFRLAPEDVDPFIDGLDPAVGRTASLQGSTEDVTLQVRDLEAQIDAAQISVDRVRALLEGATKLSDVIMLEGELTARQTTLDQLRAQKAYLDQQVALATVTVSLWTAPDDTDSSDGSILDDIGDAFARGWDAFITAVVGIVLLLGYAAPFLAVLLVAATVVIVVRRRLRRGRPNDDEIPPIV